MKFVHDDDGEIWIKFDKVQEKVVSRDVLDRLELNMAITRVRLNREMTRKEIKKFMHDNTVVRKRDENIWTLVKGEFDNLLYKAYIPYHITHNEFEAFIDTFWIEFHDPYCDGRDCTGARFSSWLSRFETKQGTWLYHSIVFDF